VTAQLLDAKDGTHLWAERYDRELSASDIFAVQDEITEQVVATIAGMSGVISRARFSEVKEKPTHALSGFHDREGSRGMGETQLSDDAIRLWLAALRKAGLPE
jgi:hypothetical protein